MAQWVEQPTSVVAKIVVSYLAQDSDFLLVLSLLAEQLDSLVTPFF